MDYSKNELEMFDYLEDLRQSGEINIVGATPYLQKEFNLDEKKAQKVLISFMENYRKLKEQRNWKEGQTNYNPKNKYNKLLTALGFNPKDSTLLSKESYKEKDSAYYKDVAKKHNVKTLHDLALLRIKKQCEQIISYIDDKENKKELPAVEKGLTIDLMIRPIKTSISILCDKNKTIDEVLEKENEEKENNSSSKKEEDLVR